jgi:hypothetical protein
VEAGSSETGFLFKGRLESACFNLSYFPSSPLLWAFFQTVLIFINLYCFLNKSSSDQKPSYTSFPNLGMLLINQSDYGYVNIQIMKRTENTFCSCQSKYLVDQFWKMDV